jgi:2-polyprenyl-3-methyl-5-hydroxy-6-metoxy-1,4-benzoquinol methylase
MGPLRGLARRLLRPPATPARLAARFRDLDTAAADTLRARLARHLAEGRPRGFLESDEGRRDLDSHLFRRLGYDRRCVVPWLDAARPLMGARVLEIGCGTGSSTLALAEQGAEVVAVDVDPRGLDVARERCRIYGLDATFVAANATEVAIKLAGECFDIVIFYASLEHMTHDERLTAMADTWNMLAPGRLWCVTDTPNRLWWFDAHTSRLPFFMWLPNDLAFDYSRFSARDYFREVYRDREREAELHFLRRGRGVSFHEFDLALGPAEGLDVVSSMRLFHRARRPLARLQELRRRKTLDVRYEAVLAEVRPDLHRGFFQRSLDLIIRRG